MTQPRNRTHRRRKITFRAPSGSPHTIFKRRLSERASCAACGKELQGIKSCHKRRTKKSGRPFAGSLCHKCVENVMKARARTGEGI